MNELFVLPLPLLVIITLIAIVSILWITYSYLKNRTLDQIRADVYRLILKAEHLYRESSAGQQKMKWVVQKARSLLPTWLQAIISDEALKGIVQMWFDEVKDLLDDGKVNGSGRKIN